MTPTTLFSFVTGKKPMSLWRIRCAATISVLSADTVSTSRVMI
jgi:hypothetical protein